MKKNLLYIIVRPIVSVWFKIFYRPTYIGKENILINDGFILAGNHTNYLDCILLMSSTKRTIHFLAKKELLEGFKKIIFANIGLIPVDRKNKNPEALKIAKNYLNNNEVIGIFPESTINRTKNLTMPFKIGAVSMANDTNTPIVPFVITGKYHLFSKNIRIEFLKPITVKDDLEKENQILRKLIEKKLEE